MRLALVLVCFAFLLVSSGTARAERVDLSEFIDPDARAAAKPRNASTREPAKKVAIAKRAKASKASKASKVKKTSKQPRKSVRAKRRR